MDDLSPLIAAITHGNHAIAVAGMGFVYKLYSRLEIIETKLKIVLKKLGIE